MSKIKITVWNEYRHERHNEEVKAIYPDGIHMALANYLNTQEDMEAKTAVLDDPEHGLTDEVLEQTDVLLWWGHLAHDEVSDEIVEKVRQKVLNGMGLIVLHSGHNSKIFQSLMGTNTGALKWRDEGEKERIWVIEPGHPIAKCTLESILKLTRKKCMVNVLRFRRRMSLFLFPGSKAERCSVADAATSEDKAISFTSDQGMRLSRYTTSLRYFKSLVTAFVGRQKMNFLKFLTDV